MSRFLQATGSLIDAIKINATARAEREGRCYCIKKRCGWSWPVAHCANAFFRAANNPICVWTTQNAWLQWEVNSYRLLHGKEGYRAFADGDAVWAERIPGEELATMATRNRLVDSAIAAAACELRRAHGIFCPALGGAWSHGDPHLGNFLFDATANRARLIDFEVAHWPELSEEDRHAEDLLTFLQDLMGVVADADWLTYAACFLKCYDRAGSGPNGVVSALRGKLEIPHGVSRVWWAIRTTYLPKAERDRRIAVLRQALQNF